MNGGILKEKKRKGGGFKERRRKKESARFFLFLSKKKKERKKNSKEKKRKNSKKEREKKTYPAPVLALAQLPSLHQPPPRLVLHGNDLEDGPLQQRPEPLGPAQRGADGVRVGRGGGAREARVGQVSEERQGRLDRDELPAVLAVVQQEAVLVGVGLALRCRAGGARGQPPGLDGDDPHRRRVECRLFVAASSLWSGGGLDSIQSHGAGVGGDHALDLVEDALAVFSVF